MMEEERLEGRTSAVSFTPLSAGRGAPVSAWLAGSPPHSIVKAGPALEEAGSSEQAVLL